MARKVAGAEAEELASEAVAWVEQNLGPGYSWPGNYRELEQCVRNVLIRRDYKSVRPARRRRYCAHIYRRTGSYEETARRLQPDRRTVKAKIALAKVGRGSDS